MDDRITLAEAMGWTCHTTGNAEGRVWMPPDFGDFFDKRDAVIAPCLPNPFTDANDDYAVLEWMRNDKKQIIQVWHKYLIELIITPCGLYQIGDYARAAVLVLDRHEP